jgi:hypothetical protein
MCVARGSPAYSPMIRWLPCGPRPWPSYRFVGERRRLLNSRQTAPVSAGTPIRVVCSLPDTGLRPRLANVRALILGSARPGGMADGLAPLWLRIGQMNRSLLALVAERLRVCPGGAAGIERSDGTSMRYPGGRRGLGRLCGTCRGPGMSPRPGVISYATSDKACRMEDEIISSVQGRSAVRSGVTSPAKGDESTQHAGAVESAATPAGTSKVSYARRGGRADSNRYPVTRGAPTTSASMRKISIFWPPRRRRSELVRSVSC